MSRKISLIRRISQIGTLLSLRLFAEEVGCDPSGNRYFKARKTPPGRSEKRAVFYAGEPEASSIPPQWYLWMHHTTEAPLAEASVFHQSWEKEHQINPTGTEAAWLPPGHALRQGGQWPGSFCAWSPSGKS